MIMVAQKKCGLPMSFYLIETRTTTMTDLGSNTFTITTAIATDRVGKEQENIYVKNNLKKY